MRTHLLVISFFFLSLTTYGCTSFPARSSYPTQEILPGPLQQYRSISWSPDGKALAFIQVIDQKTSHLKVLDIATRASEDYTEKYLQAAKPERLIDATWLKNGKLYALSCLEAKPNDCTLSTIDKEKKITTLALAPKAPPIRLFYRDDGTLFSLLLANGKKLETYTANGKQLRALSQAWGGYQVTALQWEPGQPRFAIGLSKSGVRPIVKLVNQKGKTLRTFKHPRYGITLPGKYAWHPKGRRIALYYQAKLPAGNFIRILSLTAKTSWKKISVGQFPLVAPQFRSCVTTRDKHLSRINFWKHQEIKLKQSQESSSLVPLAWHPQQTEVLYHDGNSIHLLTLKAEHTPTW